MNLFTLWCQQVTKKEYKRKLDTRKKKPITKGAFGISKVLRRKNDREE